jgi:four helix bundle protein
MSGGSGGGEMKNPKPEIRNPKQARNPKSELDCDRRELGIDLQFWSWGDEPPSDTLVLREDGSAREQPLQALDERTVRFGEAIIRFAKKIPHGPVNERLISQLVGAATSVGANYCEAEDSVSGKEFKLKIGTCRKESKEAMFFLRMIATSEPNLAPEARQLWREAKELTSSSAQSGENSQ